MNEQFIERLKALAKRKCWADKLDGDSCLIDDFAGGNVDDAYYGGRESGEIIMARDVLNAMGIEYK